MRDFLILKEKEAKLGEKINKIRLSWRIYRRAKKEDFLILKEKEAKIKKKINKLITNYLKFLTSDNGYDGAIHINDGLFIALSDETYDVFNFNTHLKGFKSFDEAYRYIYI